MRILLSPLGVKAINRFVLYFRSCERSVNARARRETVSQKRAKLSRLALQ